MKLTSTSPSQATQPWVNFNGTTNDNEAATYERTGTTVTVTLVGHGHIVGHVVQLNFITGGALDGTYTITSCPTDDTYTVTTAASGTIAAGSTMEELRVLINASAGVHSVADAGTGIYYVNFTVAFQDADYCCPGGAFGITSSTRAFGVIGIDTTDPDKTAESCKLRAFASGTPSANPTSTDSSVCHVTFTR